MKNFVLPTDLASRLRTVSDNCYHGRGFTIVKGLDPTKYCAERNVVIYSGISVYVAPQHGFLNKDRTKVVCKSLQDRKPRTVDVPNP